MLATEIPPPPQQLAGICVSLWIRTFWFYFGRTDIPASFVIGSNQMSRQTMCGCRDSNPSLKLGKLQSYH